MNKDEGIKGLPAVVVAAVELLAALPVLQFGLYVGGTAKGFDIRPGLNPPLSRSKERLPSKGKA